MNLTTRPGPSVRRAARPARLVADRRGQNSIEMLFVILITTMLLFGAFSLGQGIAVKQALDVGVAAAARGLSRRPSDWSWADSRVRAEVDNAILGGSYGAQVTVEALDSSGAPITPAQLDALPFGSEFQLRASVPFQVVVPFIPGLAGRTISATHIQLVERFP